MGPLSFKIKKGDIACLIGPNGVGKSTLFKTILGLLKPLIGSIKVKSKDYRAYSAKEFARTVAYVPQGHIPPFPYSVQDVVVMGCNPNMHELSAPGKAEYTIANEKLALMGIEHLAERDYTEVSGGERQMVMIARALAQNTELLVMDEPTTHLDYGNEARVLGQVTAPSESCWASRSAAAAPYLWSRCWLGTRTSSCSRRTASMMPWPKTLSGLP